MLAPEMDSADRLVRAIDRDRKVRVVAVISTAVVIDAARRHELSSAATYAVGRALTSGLLLATLTKGEERVTLQIMGDGPLGSIIVDANGAGDVRGYALHAQAAADLGVERRVPDAVGRKGVVNILRDLGLKELYQGQTSMVSGEIDEDIESYLVSSEQAPSALVCDVVLADDGAVVAAGGVLVQAMPGGEGDVVREVQQAMRAGALYRALREGVKTPRELAERIYTLGTLEFVGDERGVRFRCRCSAERITEMLALLGTVDLDEMIAENKPAEVVCNYCNTRYQIGRSELERIRANAAGGPRESN
jgi:molecular chaperone Hsp33